MKYDFIEIGTSTFNTLIENATYQRGLSVEPLKFCLDKLPDKPNVTKVNAAITNKDNAHEKTLKMFFIPHDIIDKYKLPFYLKGCNSIINPHPIFKRDNVEKYVEECNVPLLTISELFENYDVEEVDLLKIDTEGHDTIILNSLFDYLSINYTKVYPKKIIFESNELTKTIDINNVIYRAIQQFSYVKSYQDNENTHLELLL